MSDEVKSCIRAIMRRLRSLQDVKAAFQDVRDYISRDVDAIGPQ
nr:hypothetical protein [Pararhizobium sp. IMCC3301]